MLITGTSKAVVDNNCHVRRYD